MRGIAKAQTLAQRSSVCLARQSTGRGAIAGSRAMARPATTTLASHVLRVSALSPLPLPLPLTALGGPAGCRCFSQTAARPKKANKKEKGGAASSSKSSKSDGDEDDGSGGNHPAADPADPFNFADVESHWQRIEAHHADKFKELRRSINGGASDGGGAGGVDVEAIGQALVHVKAENLGEGATSTTGATGTKETPLSQLALVIPRAGGRVVELRMHSPAYKKAIMSAVQKNSGLFRGQQPQPDPNDELVLLIKIGGGASTGASGGTAASAAAAQSAEFARRIGDLANGWRTQIRKATSRRQKTHQGWKKDRTVQPDDLRRLDRDLLKGQEKRMSKVDAEEKDALRRVEQGRR